MAIQDLLSKQVSELDRRQATLKQRIQDLRATREQPALERLRGEHVLRALETYIADCFPQTTGTADEDWCDQEQGIVKCTFDRVQELTFEVSLIDRDISAAEAELEFVVNQLSLCTLASSADRTFDGGK